MLRHRDKAHGPEQPVENGRFGMAELDELESVGAHWILRGNYRRLSVVWIRTHAVYDLSCA
jgi:hypothetical protein